MWLAAWPAAADARAAADVIVAGNNDDGVARYLAALPELA